MPHQRTPHTLAWRLLHGPALLWLLLALVWVPSLGRMHQVAHALPLAGVHAGHGHDEGHAHDSTAHGASTLLPPLLAQHAPVDCLLLDQLALADAALGAPQALAPPPPAAPPAPWRATGTAPRHVVLFHARGPPLRALG